MNFNDIEGMFIKPQAPNLKPQTLPAGLPADRHGRQVQRIILFFLLGFGTWVLGLGSSSAQVPTPASEQTKTILLLNGTAHLGNGKVIQNSAIAFKEGKIILAADATKIRLDMSKFDTVIYIENKHVYPGFIAPNSTLGLKEIDAVRATRDFAEMGSVNPNIRSVIAYNTDSKITPTVRSNGILLAQITPRSGLISGTSSIVELDGWNWEDAVYKMDDGVHLNWPKMFTSPGWWGEPKPKEKNEKNKKQLNGLRKLFEEAKAYNEVKDPQEKNLKLEAMKGLFNGSKTFFIHVNNVKEITQAVNFIEDFGIVKTVVVGGADSWMVTDLLKKNNIAVVLGRIHRLPSKHEDDIALPYKLPFLLKEAGVLFCLENSGGMDAMGTRNLPFYAGTAATYGLSKEEALMAITSNTAKILGIDKTVGTIETGMDATLIVSTGDALDMLTNNIELAYIRGKAIDLNNHQKDLYEKFKKKYE